MVDLSRYMDFANRMADTARAVVLECLSAPMVFETKSDQSPVTEVDRKVESALRTMIAETWPEHGILGEEFDPQNLDAEYVWVIDPIDGTKAFVTGIPVFGTLIALTRNGLPVLGVIEHPVTAERWTGMDGSPSLYNGQPISTRPCPILKDAIVSNGGPDSFSAKELAAFRELQGQSKWTVYGGSCYVYGRLAMGRIDISVDAGLDPFDYCALDPVIRGAGGVITDWEGKRLSLHSGHLVVAVGNPALHAEIIATLSRAKG